MDKTLIFVIVIIILAGAGFWAWQSGVLNVGPNSVQPVAIPEGIILFYGDGCPHCKVVDDYITQNDIESKVSFARLEVWFNKDNQNILTQIVQKCGIATDQVGVPFLYGGEKCYIGQDEVIDFFKVKAGIQ